MTIFCGKGGTGKTSLSLALGLGHALRGRSAVVVTSHPLKELAASVSLSGLKEEFPDAADKLFIIHIDAVEVLNGIVRRNIPTGVLLNAVLGSSVYETLIEVAPGLKEIALLNRLHNLAEEKTEQGRKFERVIWDAPATGHFLQMLRVSRNFETYLSGPFALLGAQVAKFTADPRRFTVIPVTALEEMAVQETIEMCRQLKTELAISTTSVVCNMVSPVAASATPVEDLMARLKGETPGDVEFLAERCAVERSLFAKLREATQAELLPVRRSPSWKTNLHLLRDIAGQIENLTETAS